MFKRTSKWRTQNPSKLLKKPLLMQKDDNTVDYEYSPFFLRDSRASETRVRTKITPHKKGEKWRSREVIFTRAHVSLALLSLRKNGDYS